MPWLEDHLQSDGAAVEGSAEDRSAIASLRASGIDTNRVRDIAHSLWLPDATSARRAAELVRKPGRTVVVGPTGHESGCPVIVFVQQELSLGALSALRGEFEARVAETGGSYQGWSLAGGPKPETAGDR